MEGIHPVSKHDVSKKYLEYYAKMLLETLTPENYHGIRPWESPDLLMGDNYGIEVTWAMFDNQGRANGLLNYTQGKRKDELNQATQRNIEKTGIDFLTNEEGRIFGYDLNGYGNQATTNEIARAYLDKKKKRIHYKQETVDLFVFPPLAQLDGWLGENVIRECISDITQSDDCPFNNVIIYEEPTVYLCSNTGRYSKVCGNYQTIRACKTAADLYSGWSIRNQ